MITVGSTVARKGDRSGRTRVVKFLTTDSQGKSFATLDAFLDGWLVWSTDNLRPVKPAPGQPERKGKKDARRSLFSRQT